MNTHNLSSLSLQLQQKPDNVGFDAAGEVKIFDFGLAKRLVSEDKTDHELYTLTGNTGSLRYMAPEGTLRYVIRVTGMSVM